MGPGRTEGAGTWGLGIHCPAWGLQAVGWPAAWQEGTRTCGWVKEPVALQKGPAWSEVWAALCVGQAALPGGLPAALALLPSLRPELRLRTQLTQGMDWRPLRLGPGPSLTFPHRAESCLTGKGRVGLNSCSGRQAGHSSCHTAQFAHMKCPEPTNTETRSGLVFGGQGVSASGYRFLFTMMECSGTR